MINRKNYIKVTPKGETRSAVILSANTAFYKKHSAKIEEPTEDEILKAFPELQGHQGQAQKVGQPNMSIMNKVTEKQIELKDQTIAELKAELEISNQTIVELTNELRDTKVKPKSPKK